MTPARWAYAHRLSGQFGTASQPIGGVVTKVATANGEQSIDAKTGQFELAV